MRASVAERAWRSERGGVSVRARWHEGAGAAEREKLTVEINDTELGRETSVSVAREVARHDNGGQAHVVRGFPLRHRRADSAQTQEDEGVHRAAAEATRVCGSPSPSW